MSSRLPTSKPLRPSGGPMLPPGTPDWITLDLVHETVRVWQPHYAAPLSTDDAVAILRRVGHLFSVLSGK